MNKIEEKTNYNESYVDDYLPEYQELLEIFYAKMFRIMNFDFDLNAKDIDIKEIKKYYLDNNGKGFWILKDNKKIIGTIAIKNHNKYSELKRFYILPEYQNKGYGKKLLQCLMDYARINNIKKIRLDTTRKSEKAIKLFRKYNFKEIKRYNNDPYAEIFMELNLSA